MGGAEPPLLLNAFVDYIGETLPSLSVHVVRKTATLILVIVVIFTSVAAPRRM